MTSRMQKARPSTALGGVPVRLLSCPTSDPIGLVRFKQRVRSASSYNVVLMSKMRLFA